MTGKDNDLERRRIAVPGESCWRRERAARAAFLIDADAYFKALRAAMCRAERSILIVGWELHTRLAMDPRHPGDADLADGLPNRLDRFIKALADRTPALEIRLLIWDYAAIYLVERELRTRFADPWGGHPRIVLHHDDAHPVGGSQHQKLVVVDDRVAFCGGLDITTSRWDTPEHAADDPRRRTPGGRPYGPFHDVQMVVDGAAARALGVLARERWARARGERLPAAEGRSDPWPEGLTPDLRDVEVAIARTLPAFDGHEEVREIEALYRAAIAGARRCVYLENQYLTSKAVGEAIAERLQEADGPEFVIVCPWRAGGWLEEAAMGTARARLLQRLREADRFGRLAVYAPVVPGLQVEGVMVHAKVLVVDDRLVRVGSSNTANRSMGLDSECDLVIEADGRRDVAEAILGFRNRLLGEHLGTTPQAVAAALEAEGSLIAAVESLRGGDRTLRPLEATPYRSLVNVVSQTPLFDPDRPLLSASDEQMDTEAMPHALADALAEAEDLEGPDDDADDPAEAERGRGWPWPAIATGLVLLLAAASWRFGPLAELTDLDWLVATLRDWSRAPAAGAIAIAAMTLAGLVAFPINLAAIAIGLVFGPLDGLAYAFLGALAGALLGFWIGRLLGRRVVARFLGPRFRRLDHALARRGLLAVTLFRLVPVAPFVVVNLAMGVTRVRARDFLLGSVIGLSPGLFAFVVLGDSLTVILTEPSLGAVALALGVLALAGAAGLAARYQRRRRRRSREAESRT